MELLGQWYAQFNFQTMLSNCSAKLKKKKSQTQQITSKCRPDGLSLAGSENSFPLVALPQDNKVGAMLFLLW